jgi:phage baseplate assembly protein W
MASRADQSHLGRGWSFPPAFELSTGSVAMVEGELDILQSLKILFATAPGERVLRPEYGCDLRRFLFEAMDLSKTTEFKDVIGRAILYGEPRIKVNRIDVDTTGYLDGRLLLELDYTIIATNTRSNRVFPLYLQEGTLLQR